ncbi:MAG: geranylgeranyl diphosphate synthase type I [Halovenus sp.]|jgi:geranylgeranyl diphosphate synthase type I
MTRKEDVEAALMRLRPVVDDALSDVVRGSPPEQLADASEHLIEAGGKRLRPVILLLAAEAVADRHVDPGGTEETGLLPEISNDPESYRAFPAADGSRVDVLTAAACIEVVHTFSLIHDDILDDDNVRRGVPAVHRQYGDDMAILAGDKLFARSFELLLETGASPDNSVPALGMLARTCVKLCEGEGLDISFEERESVSVPEYLQMVDLKTGVLFAATASIPAVLLGHREAVDPLAGYGREVGRAFQIKDDLLDLTASTEALGKQRGSDLVEGKQTIVTAHAREQGVDIDNLVESDTVESVTEAEIDDAVEQLESAGSIAYAREMARDCVERGKRHISSLPEKRPRRLLTDVAEHLVEREY